MSNKGLTQSEKRLLERHHDGVLKGREKEQVESLLAMTSVARDYAASLVEIHEATVMAEAQIWSQADAPASAVLSELAMADAGSLEEVSFSKLESMLVRYHDGEVTREEQREIQELAGLREDVSGFLGGLGELELGVQSATKEAVDAVDFSGFWGKLESAMDAHDEPEEELPEPLSFPHDTRERPQFNGEDHQVLLYRYHDGEVSEEERTQVQAWQEIDPGVALTLGALSELKLAACASMELAEERMEPGLMWSLIEDKLDESSHVTSLSDYKQAKDHATGQEVAPVANHRREMFIALAAVLCTVLGVAVFSDSLFPSNQVIVEKTVVIVDSLEYGDGTSVMVTGPMQSASMEVESDDEVVDDEEESTPTVIWLIDPESDAPAEDASDSKEEEATTPRSPGVPQGKPI